MFSTHCAYINRLTAWCAGVIAVSLLVPLAAGAQGLGGNAYLKVAPETPHPGEQFSVSFEFYASDISGADIRWYIQGGEDQSLRGSRSITLRAGALGEPVSVQATIGTFSLSTTVTPSIVDIIVEADTRTPSFYKGRALPAAGEPVTVTALPHTGENSNPGSFFYTWKLGTDVLYGGAVAGRNRASFTMPRNQTYLSVEIKTREGKRVAKETVALKPSDPELYFYEDNPLRGLSARAIGGVLPFIGEETSIRAEPYFVATDIFTANAKIEWAIDGRPVTLGNNPGTLTLFNAGGGERANVGFSLINRDSLLQSVRDSFTILFD